MFERLDDEGIVVGDYLRFYPYRATFDFEYFFTGDNVPADTDHLQWIVRHVPLSVSIASNVPGYEPAQCSITDGDSDKLVGDMMRGLSAISDAAFDMLMPSYESALHQLKTLKEAWDEAESEANTEEEENEESKTNPYRTLIGQLIGWLHQLPVVVLKGDDKTRFVIRRHNTYMCFATKKLKFLDVTQYLAPGVSYANYLKAYGCELQKGHFPYEYMDDLQKLEESVLPPQAAFFSQLKNKDISDVAYARCQAVWGR